MSYKNLLQELFQKKKIPLPIYTQDRVGGTDHNPLWVSKVILYDGQTFIGERDGNKSNADSSAAKKAYDLVTKASESNRIALPSNTSGTNNFVCILVDVENLPLFIEQIQEKFTLPSNVHLYAFIASNHVLANKDFGKGVTKVISNSSRSDGTDTCIQVYVGNFLQDETYDNYIIVTRDHFGASLVDIITSKGMIWKPAKAYNVIMVEELSSILK